MYYANVKKAMKWLDKKCGDDYAAIYIGPNAKGRNLRGYVYHFTLTSGKRIWFCVEIDPSDYAPIKIKRICI